MAWRGVPDREEFPYPCMSRVRNSRVICPSRVAAAPWMRHTCLNDCALEKSRGAAQLRYVCFVAKALHDRKSDESRRKSRTEKRGRKSPPPEMNNLFATFLARFFVLSSLHTFFPLLFAYIQDMCIYIPLNIILSFNKPFCFFFRMLYRYDL